MATKKVKHGMGLIFGPVAKKWRKILAKYKNNQRRHLAKMVKGKSSGFRA